MAHIVNLQNCFKIMLDICYAIMYTPIMRKETINQGRGEMRLFVKEKASGAKISCAKDVADSCKEIADADQEVMLVIGYNNQNTEIFREVIFKGGLNHSSADLKVLFRHLLLKNCASFVLAHNHPSGIVTPSTEDGTFTRTIKEASKVIDIKFLDHIIIGDDKYYSFADTGLI